MPVVSGTHNVKVNLVSNFAHKSFTFFLLKENAMITGLCVAFIVILIFFIPGSMTGRAGGFPEASEVTTNWERKNPFILVFVGVIFTALVNIFVSLKKDQFYIVGIVVENDIFKITTRKNAIKSVREYTGPFDELVLHKEMIKLPFDSTRVCYKFYHKTEYLGLFLPEHFIWSDCPNLKIMTTLKKLKSNLRPA